MHTTPGGRRCADLLYSTRHYQGLVRKLLDAKGQGPQVVEWERELNALVYELYSLTEEEIAIVEGQS